MQVSPNAEKKILVLCATWLVWIKRAMLRYFRRPSTDAKEIGKLTHGELQKERFEFFYPERTRISSGNANRKIESHKLRLRSFQPHS